MTNYNDGKWHGWHGGECPLHPETVVRPMFEGDKLGGEIKVKDLEWHDAMVLDIIAFRVIKEHKEPREFWIAGPFGMMGIFKTQEAALCAYESDEIIHVREVIE